MPIWLTSIMTIEVIEYLPLGGWKKGGIVDTGGPHWMFCSLGGIPLGLGCTLFIGNGGLIKLTVFVCVRPRGFCWKANGKLMAGCVETQLLDGLLIIMIYYARKNWISKLVQINTRIYLLGLLFDVSVLDLAFCLTQILNSDSDASLSLDSLLSTNSGQGLVSVANFETAWVKKIDHFQITNSDGYQRWCLCFRIGEQLWIIITYF